MSRLPAKLHWLFWEHDASALDVERHADSICARVLEFGGWSDVRWLLATYGKERIHRFFREVGHPELTDRTIHFWRAFFRAEDEQWVSPPVWRRSSSIPWHD